MTTASKETHSSQPLSSPAFSEVRVASLSSVCSAICPGRRSPRAASALALLSFFICSTTWAMPLFRAPFLSYDMGHTFAPGFAVADVNGDGRPDLVAISGTHELAVRLGNGDGTFGPRIDHDTQAPFPQSLVVADLDQDTRLDVAVTTSIGVTIRFGNGDGTFRPGANVPAQYSPEWIAAVDLNGDTWQDLVFRREVAYQVYAVSVMLGTGNGTFGPITDFTLAGSEAIQGLSLGDLNGDHHIDAVVPMGDGALKILLGNGDGTFGPETDDGSYRGLMFGQPIVLSDLNHDDRLDAIVPAYPNTVIVRLGLGDGHFEPGTPFETGPSAKFVAVGDLDSDGNADVMITNESDGTVSVLRGLGDGTLGPHAEFPGGSGTPALADFNHDQIPDLALRNRTTASILLGNGDATFGNGLGFPETEFSFNRITAADLNDDTRPDLLVSGYYYIGIYLGNGDGTFVRSSVVTEPGFGGTEATAVGDFDEDHRKDLAISTGGSRVRIQFGNGDGTFNAGPGLQLSDYNARTLAVVDLNGDSHDDIVVPIDHGNIVSVFLGIGDGTFGSGHDFATGLSPTAVAAGDLNGDNLLDLVVTNEGTVSVLLNDGAGGFGGHTDYFTGGGPALVLAHLNHDAALDLVVNGATVMLGNGDGSFGAATNYYPSVGEAPLSFAVADLNGDGSLDIATTGFPNCCILSIREGASVLLGNGDGTFQPPQDFGGGVGSRSVAVADFDGSGFPDLAVANSFSNSVSVLLNTTIPGGGAPDCSRATATIAELWPPNHQMVRVSIVGVTDPDGDPVSITITGVTQDEPINGLGDGDTCPDAQLDGGDVLLRAERSGLGKGRVYRVSFTASDGRGGECTGAVTVCVPHNRSASGRVCVDDGQTVDSLGRCGGGRSGGNIRVQLPTAQSGKVVIQYSLAEGGFVDLVIYDVTGRRVATLVKQRQTAGSHQVGWNGARFPAGVYFARLRTDDGIETQSIVLVK